MPERLIQPPEPIQIRHHKDAAPGGSELFLRPRDEGPAIKQAGKAIEPRDAATGLSPHNAGGPNTILEPDALPEAGVDPAKQTEAKLDFGAGRPDLKEFRESRTVFRLDQGPKGAARALGRKWSKAQRTGGTGETQAIRRGLPQPQRDHRGPKRLKRRRRVPSPAVVEHPASRSGGKHFLRQVGAR